MKKYLILSLLFLLAGCIRNEDFKKTCSYEVTSAHFKDKTTIYVTYDNEDLIKTATITKNYLAIDKEGNEIINQIKAANQAYNVKFGGSDVKIATSISKNNEYEIKYYLDVQNISDDILNEFKIRKNSSKFFNKMKNEKIECED